LDNPNACEDDWEADCEPDMEPENGFEDLEGPEQRDVSAAPNVPGLIRPTRKSKAMGEKGLVIPNPIETRRNWGNNTK